MPRARTPAPVIVERAIHLADASSLLAVLDRDHEYWGGAPNNWIFRGHADARWSLLPTALRPGAYLGTWREPVVGPARNALTQAEAEADLIIRFLAEADELGLAIPREAEEELHRVFGKSPLEPRQAHVRRGDDGTPEVHHPDRDTFFRDWPNRGMLTAVAIARHHGIPTRLLDWSYNPLTAAYFAASEAARIVRGAAAGRPRSRGAPKYISVWALNRGHVTQIAANYQRLNCVAWIEHTPRSWAARQAAQHGLFTVMRRVPDDAPTFHQIDKFLESANDHVFARQMYPPAVTMRQLLVPVSEAPLLLRKLADRFISAATVTPDYLGAAQAVQERFYWDQMPEGM